MTVNFSLNVGNYNYNYSDHKNSGNWNTTTTTGTNDNYAGWMDGWMALVDKYVKF